MSGTKCSYMPDIVRKNMHFESIREQKGKLTTSQKELRIFYKSGKKVFRRNIFSSIVAHGIVLEETLLSLEEDMRSDIRTKSDADEIAILSNCITEINNAIKGINATRVGVMTAINSLASTNVDKYSNEARETVFEEI